MNFFFDYGFRSVLANEAGAISGVVTLARPTEIGRDD